MGHLFIMARKAFNFYRSYYEVAKELSEKDRAAFLMAILEKQFLNKEPVLTGMAKFAYLSQEHSILSQVKGYVDKCKDLEIIPFDNPTEPPFTPPTEPPSGQEKEQEKEEVKVKEEVKDIIDYLNLVCKTNFKYSKNSTKHINARLNDGFSLDELKDVIEFKFKQWGNDSKMSEYLRPETLFGSKFESYLNASKVKISSNVIDLTKFNFNH